MVMFPTLDGSEQSFEGTIVNVEPAGPKPVKVKFSGGDEESYSIEEANASLVPQKSVPLPRSHRRNSKRAAPAGANTTMGKAGKKTKTSAHKRQVRTV